MKPGGSVCRTRTVISTAVDERIGANGSQSLRKFDGLITRVLTDPPLDIFVILQS